MIPVVEPSDSEEARVLQKELMNCPRSTTRR